MALRALIMQTAATTPGVGTIEESLKWGEPAFITSASKSGSTVRIGWKAATPDQYFMYFICTTNLIETFKTIFPHDFEYEGNRVQVVTPVSPLGQTLLGRKAGDEIEVRTQTAREYEIVRCW